MSDDLRTPRAATSIDLSALIEVVTFGSRADSDVATLKDWYAQVRLQSDREWPERVRFVLDELFYVMEEHSRDPHLRAEQGGLDDEALRAAMASLLPALDEGYHRMRAEEEGRNPPPITVTTSSVTASTHLLETVQAFVSGALDSTEFASRFSQRRALTSDELSPRVLAAVEIVQRALDALVPTGERPRFYDLDEDGLRIRVADVEPRLADAVAEL